MPIFEIPPLETLPQVKDRWTPIYLEHGRLEVDDSSVKWIQADGLVCAIPVASVSTVMLGPGTSVTHAAMLACANSNTMVQWVSQDAVRFYAWGVNTSANNANARNQARIYGNRNKRTIVARRMFAIRFGEDKIVADKSINELRGMEGIRWRRLYSDLANKYNVCWNKRDYDKTDWNDADDINKAISTANASLHALCNSIICATGYISQIGFLHDDSAISFACDIADIFKAETSLPTAFSVVGEGCESHKIEETVIERLKIKYEETKIMKRVLPAIEFLFNDL